MIRSRDPFDSPARMVAVVALFAAMLSVSAWIAVPFGPVPFTLQTLVLFLAALLLRPRTAAVAVVVYLLIGIVGVPVFSGMRGGLGVIVGPTGGFLLGFLAGAPLGATVRRLPRTLVARRGRRGERRGGVVAGDAGAVCSVMIAVYALGWAQLMLVAGLTPAEAALAGVAPFVAVDLAKGVAAVVLASSLRRALGVRDSVA